MRLGWERSLPELTPTADTGALPEKWRTLARLSDLVAWADLLSRPGVHRSVVDSARIAIAETVGGVAR